MKGVQMNKFQKLLVVGGSVVLAVAARAEDVDPFAASIAKLTAAPVAIAAIAGSLAAIAAGVMIWKKIKSYFGKAG